MVPGCLSITLPCTHQQGDPKSLCDVCQAASDRQDQKLKAQAVIDAKPQIKLKAPTVVQARQLKPDDFFKWKGNIYRVDRVAFADGKDGRPLTMTGGPHLKSACALEVNCMVEVFYIHPSQDVTVI